MNIHPILLLQLGFVLLATGPASAESSYSAPPGINVLSSSSSMVGNLVKTHFPEARTQAFEGVIHFEHATGLHVLPAISKNPELEPEVVRGPLNGGIWCDIQVVEGGLGESPAYARAEGGIDRNAFMEYRYHVDPPLEKGHHLIVTLRLPKDPGEMEKKFIQKLRETLKQFRIDRQSGIPSTR